MKYWLEAVACALEEAGITATSEQTKAIASDMERAREMYAEAHGHLSIENPAKEEMRQLHNRLEVARKEAEEWRCAFRANVQMRHPKAYDIDLHKDGNAEYKI